MSLLDDALPLLGEAQPSRFRAYTTHHLDRLAVRAGFGPTERFELQAVATVLPFRTNKYVVEELIDWNAAPDDPIFRLTVPQPDMLPAPELSRMVDLLRGGAAPGELNRAAQEIRARLNPHPSGQLHDNVPSLHGRPLPGTQHKYRQTLLVFPRQGQTCHAYCTYCFRWAQFVGEPDLKIATDDIEAVRDYLLAHPEITSVLFTGGDPMVMSTTVLARYVEPLLDPRLETLESIRFGTKSLAYWPHRFVLDKDSEELLRLFERVVAAGKHVAVMAHFSHPRELEPELVQEALRRIRGTGALTRCQAPLIRGINDTPEAWVELWQQMVRMSTVPYYMFVERDTGPQDYFAVPLVRAHDLFREAYQRVSGLARTVRGPIMSAMPGKVSIDGIAEIGQERVFVLRLIQARNPDLVNRPFFARYDPTAIWLTDLVPALGATRFPFDAEEPPASPDPRS